jgi:phosphate transport system substrate-binding protein
MKFFYIILLLTIIIFLTGCPSKNDKPPVQKKTSITIKGSDTMTLILESLSEEFMKNNRNVEIFVDRGGTSAGIEGLLNKTTDIAAASRPINDRELKLADKNGTDIKEYPLARDAIVIIINKKNSIKELSLEDIRNIFTGTINKWEEAGGGNLPLNIYNHSSESGTYHYFKENILKRNNFTDKVKILEKPCDIIHTLSKDPGGISYICYQYYIIASDQVKAVSIKNKNNSKSIMPSEENIIKGLYPLSRILYLYTSYEPSQTTASFIDFCTGKEGQKIMKDNEAIPYQ